MKAVFATAGVLFVITGWFGIAASIINAAHDKWFEWPLFILIAFIGLVMSEYFGFKTCECCKKPNPTA